MKRLILSIIVPLLFPSLIFAHPGRTASDGCHYCRTNCEKWGVPEGERHCHGNRIEEFKSSKFRPDKRKISLDKKQLKVPGWEYRMQIQKINIPSMSLPPRN